MRPVLLGAAPKSNAVGSSAEQAPSAPSCCPHPPALLSASKTIDSSTEEGSSGATPLPLAQVIRQLQASTYVLNSDSCTNEEWAALEAAHDVVARPKYYTATVTSRGMARAVFLLGERWLFDLFWIC